MTHVRYPHLSEFDDEKCTLRRKDPQMWSMARRTRDEVFNRTGVWSCYHEGNRAILYYTRRPSDGDYEGRWVQSLYHPDNTPRWPLHEINKVVEGVRAVMQGRAQPPSPILVLGDSQHEGSVHGSPESPDGLSERRGEQAGDAVVCDVPRSGRKRVKRDDQGDGSGSPDHGDDGDHKPARRKQSNRSRAKGGARGRKRD